MPIRSAIQAATHPFAPKHVPPLHDHCASGSIHFHESHIAGRDDDKMRRAVNFVCALIGVAVCTPALAEEQKKPQASTRFTLVCSSQLLRKTIAVDTARRTIDGKSANFSDTSITWKTEDAEVVWRRGEQPAAPKRSAMHELNRIEGTYRSWDEGATAETSATYSCEKAPPQKF